jgi:hypothetical protein
MQYILVLAFACGQACGNPATVTIDTSYAFAAQCEAAGKLWTAPVADPRETISSYECRWFEDPAILR